MLGPTEAEPLDVLLRAVQDRPKLDRRVDRHVDVPERRLVRTVAQVLIEAGVLLVGDLPLGLDPDRLLVVDDGAVNLDRVLDEPRIRLEDGLDPVVVGELLGVVLELEDDLGPSRQPFGRLDGEGARAVRLPLVACLFAKAPRADANGLGKHERRVKPDAELADQRDIRLTRFRRILEEFKRAAPRDRPQVGHEFIAGHADPVVADDQLGGVGPAFDGDLQRSTVSRRFLGHRDEPHLVEGVGGVRDQLADRDVAALIKRVREQLQELLDLGLEAELFASRLGRHR